ncbi:AraC family transcriptional regulator [Vibrio renipiscarius]|uniref:AraC family transcriptional regulator n=1 Tax=Vibrio renipiscarius TaxID=1461322 RepID=A0A0C2K0R1_9VIBR|nr:AraC family transcriptional regulator [Vibrio renipiscarius]KII75498.1 AraC family transcriptional regulator [Vibrio renipiscarius]KII78511.1 AraC family transcriptional regulator [Vibrio renipiscarius]
MKKALWSVLLYFFANVALAFDTSPSVFYSLPTHDQGWRYAAKKLFLAPGGGIWIHDVRDKVLFFDGKNVTPKVGSALPYSTEHFQFQANRFWTYQDNAVYRSLSHQQREVVFRLPPGSEINKLGSISDYIWVTDERSFYTYQISTGALKTYSLMEMYQYNRSTKMQVNDALFIKTKWVLATNGGVYLSEGDSFIHVPRSKNRDVSSVYFSDNRRELLHGAATGAVVYDINHPEQPKYIIPAPGVMAIAETKDAYWLGTENGLYIYSFLTGEITKYSGADDARYTLIGQKINTIINDNAGGMWIGTNKGIQYYSLFGDKFERFPIQDFYGYHFDRDNYHGRLKDLVAMENKSGFWMVTDTGLYQIKNGRESEKELIKSGIINGLAEIDGVLWVATSKGISRFDVNTGQRMDSRSLPPLLVGQEVSLMVEGNEGHLWGINARSLWRYNIETQQITEFGDSLISSNLASLRITQIMPSKNNHLLIGTDRGVYLLRDGQLNFVENSAQFGVVLSMTEGEDEQVWIASSYGLNIVDLRTAYLKNLTLIDEHISPQCLIKNTSGMWLTSSAGLTHYGLKGEFVSHYGQPFGLINNEFQNGFCLKDVTNSEGLLLGSWHSLVRVNSEDLVVNPLPETKTIFSQVKINQSLVSFGSISQNEIVAPYGATIEVKMGLLPSVSSSTLEYRLNDDPNWTPLDGYQILIDGLTPGQYQLYVRPVVNGVERGREKSIEFSVTAPWYLTSMAMMLYVLSFAALFLVVIYWRSKVMSKSNRELKAQVSLKTNQLRHQSRILVSNNHQLRKQLQVRRLILSQAIQSFRDRLHHEKSHLSDDEGREQSKIADNIANELGLLLNVRESKNEALAAYNLSLISTSIFDGWKKDFTKAGLTVELEAHESRQNYVLLEYFNLDILFNLLFEGLIKRCFKHQTIQMQILNHDDRISLNITDYGLAIDVEKESSWPEIESLVDASGGEVSLQRADGKNVIAISWQSSPDFDEHSLIEFSYSEGVAMPRTGDKNQDSWIDKLENLVRDHYSDSEFSTSTAAKMMFVSERSLQRRFKTATQRTFTDYLSEIRLDNACRRLLAGAKVSDVAFDCGFNDPSYFSQRFKHRFGVSPTQFVEDQYPHNKEVPIERDETI